MVEGSLCVGFCGIRSGEVIEGVVDVWIFGVVVFGEEFKKLVYVFVVGGV